MSVNNTDSRSIYDFTTLNFIAPIDCIKIFHKVCDHGVYIYIVLTFPGFHFDSIMGD